jgi:hypothetical protein
MALTATPIDKNQYDYLTGLSKTGTAGNQTWAKSQLAGSVYTPPAPVKAPTQIVTPVSATTTPKYAVNGAGSGGKPITTLPGDQFGSTPTVNSTAQQQQIVNPNAPVAATATPNQGSYPGQLTTAQIAAEAQARIDKQRAALMGAVTGAKTGLKNTYDYTQGLQKDNRTLEDAQNQRTLNPFSGGTDYKTAMLSRDRQIADTASSKDYNAQVAGYDAQVASFDTLAPEQQSALIDDLTRQERQYGLDVGSLTGQFNGGQTLAAKTADQNYQLGLSGLSGQLPNGAGQTIQGQTAALNNQGQALSNQMAQLKLTDYPAESQAQAQLVQQQLTSGSLSNEAATYNLAQLKDPNSPTNQAAKLDLQMKQIDASNYPQEAKLKLQQLQKQIADIGVVHKTPQTADQIEYDKQKVLEIKANIEKIQADTNKALTPTPKYSTAEEFSKYIDSTPLVSSVGGIRTVSDPVAMEKAILSSGMTPEEMTKAYIAYKIPMK